MEVTPAILLTLKTEPVQVFDKTALTWIVPRKNPGFAELVNRMAQESAKAQGHKRPLTSFERLVDGDDEQKLFILWENGTKPMAYGYAKLTRKQLYLRDRTNQSFVHSPICIMDFYIHESTQKQERSIQLFNFILENEQQHAYQLAFDNPSPALLSFLATHYNCTDPLHQSNRFVVFDKFFEGLEPQAEAYGYTSTPSSRVSSRRSSFGKSQEMFPARNGASIAAASHRGTVAEIINGEQPLNTQVHAPAADTPHGMKYTRDYGHQKMW